MKGYLRRSGNLGNCDVLVNKIAVREFFGNLVIEVLGVADHIDIATPIGLAMFTFQNAIGSLERKNFLHRSKDAMLRLPREGSGWAEWFLATQSGATKWALGSAETLATAVRASAAHSDRRAYIGRFLLRVYAVRTLGIAPMMLGEALLVAAHGIAAFGVALTVVFLQHNLHSYDLNDVGRNRH